MDYEAETQVLFARYGISAYDNYPDADCDSTGATSADNPIDILPNISAVN